MMNSLLTWFSSRTPAFLSRTIAVALLAGVVGNIGVVSNASEPDAMPAKRPRLPWHMADVWWKFEETTPHFESLDVDVTIDRDVPPEYNLYISPCGLGELSGVKFYGGLQTNANGWASKEKQERVFIGKGAIFSRWGKGALSVAQARGAEGTHYEAAGYEGDFVSVRRPLAWTKGTYTWSLRACDTETVDGKDYTWVTCFVSSHETRESRFIGSLRFEGKDLTYWNQHAAFVEIYATAKIPKSDVPEVKVTFGYPRINGRPPKFKSASVNYPGPGQPSGSPDVAKAVAEGANVAISISPAEFPREAADRRQKLELSNSETR